LLPGLTVNAHFMREFASTDIPCFALGMTEERGRRCGFVALRLGRVIPSDIAKDGFRFGHSLLDAASYEVMHFAFAFNGFETNHALVNPNNPLVRTVLTMMVESGDYFFFAVNWNGSATAFRSEIGKGNLALLKANLSRIQRSETTEAQYRGAVSFLKRREQAGALLHWVCRDNIEYLDISKDRLALTPAAQAI
jgi:hypothetical protein